MTEIGPVGAGNAIAVAEYLSGYLFGIIAQTANPEVISGAMVVAATLTDAVDKLGNSLEANGSTSQSATEQSMIVLSVALSHLACSLMDAYPSAAEHLPSFNFIAMEVGR